MANKPMSKQTVQRSRRKLLTLLSAGVAATKLPDVWSRPTVASVMLPAHAARSPASSCTGAMLILDTSTGDASFTFLLAGRAFDLPDVGSFYANFTFFTFNYVLEAVSIAPGTRGATMAQSITLPYGSICDSVLAVNFYTQGDPGNTLCGTSTTANCVTLTI